MGVAILDRAAGLHTVGFSARRSEVQVRAGSGQF